MARGQRGGHAARPFPLSGSSPDVGVVGYTLGGGLSWLSRKRGLAANSVTAIELVTPDARSCARPRTTTPTCSGAARRRGELRHRHRDGVPPVPYAEVYAGMFLWPYERHAEVLRTWHEWTRARRRRSPPRCGSCTCRRCPTSRRSWPGVGDGRRRRVRRVGRGRREAVAALRALEREMDLGRRVPGRAEPDPHRPQGADPLPQRRGAARPARRRRARGIRRADPARAPVLFGGLRHLGGALSARRRPRARSGDSRPSSCCSRSGS